MELVINGFLTLGLLLAGAWVWSLRGSLTRDRATAQARQRQAEEQAAEEAARAEREAQLQRRGERLRCLNCEKVFRGPLPADGCPRCHLASLVVPEAQEKPQAQKKTAKEK